MPWLLLSQAWSSLRNGFYFPSALSPHVPDPTRTNSAGTSLFVTEAFSRRARLAQAAPKDHALQSQDIPPERKMDMLGLLGCIWVAVGFHMAAWWQEHPKSTSCEEDPCWHHALLTGNCSFRRRPLKHPHGVWGLAGVSWILPQRFLKQPRTIHPHHFVTGPANPLGIKISLNLDRRLQCFGTRWQIALHLNHCVNLNSTASQQQVWDTGLFARGTA